MGSYSMIGREEMNLRRTHASVNVCNSRFIALNNGGYLYFLVRTVKKACVELDAVMHTS